MSFNGVNDTFMCLLVSLDSQLIGNTTLPNIRMKLNSSLPPSSRSSISKKSVTLHYRILLLLVILILIIPGFNLPKAPMCEGIDGRSVSRACTIINCSLHEDITIVLSVPTSYARHHIGWLEMFLPLLTSNTSQTGNIVCTMCDCHVVVF